MAIEYNARLAERASNNAHGKLQQQVGECAQQISNCPARCRGRSSGPQPDENRGPSTTQAEVCSATLFHVLKCTIAVKGGTTVSSNTNEGSDPATGKPRQQPIGSLRSASAKREAASGATEAAGSNQATSQQQLHKRNEKACQQRGPKAAGGG
eukprot:7448418-Alexandrium_andersonii.AAC.1